eukprot:5365414-Pleurochrysis_carterae.AAC.2
MDDTTLAAAPIFGDSSAHATFGLSFRLVVHPEHALMRRSSTLSFAAGVYQWKSDDSANLFPAWLALLHQKIGTAEPSSLEIHGGERTLVISSDVVIRIFARP